MLQIILNETHIPPSKMEDDDDASMKPDGAPPRTPSQVNSADEDASDKNSDSCSDRSSDEDDDEDRPQKRRRAFKRREWEELQVGRWDTNELLESEINIAVLQLATKHMTDFGLVEWPVVKKSTKMKRLYLWAQYDEYTRDNGATTIETYHCPLKDRCKCPCQLRIIRSATVVSLECSHSNR